MRTDRPMTRLPERAREARLVPNHDRLVIETIEQCLRHGRLGAPVRERGGTPEWPRPSVHPWSRPARHGSGPTSTIELIRRRERTERTRNQ